MVQVNITFTIAQITNTNQLIQSASLYFFYQILNLLNNKTMLIIIKPHTTAKLLNLPKLLSFCPLISFRYSHKNKMQHEIPKYRFYDIAANLTDDQFGGSYHGKENHPDDRHQVIERAKKVGCDHLLIAAGCIEDAVISYKMCQQYDNCFATIGVHPCRAKEPFDQNRAKSVDEYFVKLQEELVRIQPKLVAIGECGLDYDRLEWSTKEEQLEVFPYHFDLAEKYKLPMYLHNRNTGNDFYEIVRKNRDRFSTGCVHSFTGTQEQLQQILQLDLYVGINGCSLKTEENIEVVRKIPLDKLMIQTDSPYCEIKNSSAAAKYVKTKFPAKPKNKKKPEDLVKGRNEPCKIVEVFEAVSAILEIQPEELAKVAFQNSLKVFAK